MSVAVVLGVGVLGGVGAVARFLLDGAVARAARASVPVRHARRQPQRRARARRARRRGARAATRYGSPAPACSARTRRSRRGCSSRTGSPRTASSRSRVRRTSSSASSLGLAAACARPHARERRCERRLPQADDLLRRARPRATARSLADALLDLFARHGLQPACCCAASRASALKHHLRTDRLLTLSEDLPLVAVAVDERARDRGALPEVRGCSRDGLVTLERARLRTEALAAPAPGARGDASSPSTSAAGPQRPAPGLRGRRRAACAATASPARPCCSASTAPPRRSASARAFFGRNADVPLMVVAVGDGARDRRRAAPSSRDAARRPLATLERVRVCKRDGALLAEPRLPAPTRRARRLAEAHGLRRRAAPHGGRPLHAQLVRAPARGGRGAARRALRGIWGYHGDHAPHGDRLLAAPPPRAGRDGRRRPPERIARWFRSSTSSPRETGLVTSELVPAFRAVGGGERRGGLRLASPAEPPP